MKRLDLAKKALSKAALAEALGHLVAAFIERALTELAALVERFEAAHPPPAFEGDTAAFKKVAKKADVETVGALARALKAPKTADTLARLEALTPHEADPRVSALLERPSLGRTSRRGTNPTAAFGLRRFDRA
ncbi:MAG: hypothetical protein SFW67_19205 [Myxococcaceae bacterium]|nr:hypothetical protein [Myxococcaceae bacterium]